MSRALIGSLLLVGWWVPGAARADEALPAPRKLPAAPVVVPAVPPAYPTFLRTNRYDVWQYYGVNRWGYWRPRVIYSPSGSFYLYNGAPFPWAQSRPREWQRHVAGTPYRYPPLPPPVYMPYLKD
jgi:hypothetical protein